jgi:RimJ/RimL family protein N-acetyltransferase
MLATVPSRPGATLPGLTLRDIRPGDKALLAEGLARLSPRSAHARFLTAKATLTSRELRYLTEVDGHDHAALVAIDAAGRLVAVARYVRDHEDPAMAEVAVVVGDHLQGLGLGTRMGLELADRARHAGILRFTAIMLPDNTPAMKLFARISARLRSSFHDGVRELVAELNAA